MSQKNSNWIKLLVLMAGLLFLPIAVSAEVVYPVPSYDNDALAKVREWEKNWAGKKIDKPTLIRSKNISRNPLFIFIKSLLNGARRRTIPILG